MTSTSDQLRMSSRAAIKDELAGRLHFNDDRVLQRLGIDRIPDDFVEACYFGLMNDSTQSARFSELRETVLDAEDEDGEIRGARATMYPILEYTLNYIGYYEWDGIHNGPGSRSRHFLRCSDEDLTSEAHTPGLPNINPGLILLDSETPIVESQNGDGAEKQRAFCYSLEWHYRAGFVVVKPTSFEGPMPPEDGPTADIVLRAADYARLHIAARPFQLFSVSLLVYGLKFCVAIFDHDGVTFSREGDLRTPNGWKLLARIVRCLSVTMTDEDLGRDPTARLLNSGPTIFRLQEEARSLGITVPDNFPTFSVSLGGKSGRRWGTIAMIWSSLSLVGRGTSVWLVQELREGKPEGAVKVMKTAWRSNRRMPEAQIYKALQEQQTYRCHPCVAKFDIGGDVNFLDERTISVSALRATGSDETQGSEDKILHRLLLSPVGRPIWEYESEEMLIRGIKAAVQGHRYLHEHGILHRDVSAGNVLLATHAESESAGFITDLDYARLSDDSPPAKSVREVPHGGHITGTYQFMSIRILELMTWHARKPGVEIFNELRDDLESFVWVFCYAIMRHHVLHRPNDVEAQKRFGNVFGHLSLNAIEQSRVGCQPIRAIAVFEESLSLQLLQWFQQQPRLLMRPPLYDGETGFEFTYETLIAWLDTALAAIWHALFSSGPSAKLAISPKALKRSKFELSTKPDSALYLRTFELALVNSASIDFETHGMMFTSDEIRMSSRAAIKDELAGRLHFNDDRVLQRLGIDRIPDDFVEACYFGLMNDSTHSALFSELRETVLDAEDEDGEIRGAKATMYPILEYTLNYIGYYEWDGICNGPNARSRHFLRCSDEDLASEAHTPGLPNINPGLILLDSETPIVESKEENDTQHQKKLRYSLQWRYRAGFVVVKPTSFEGPMPPEDGPMADIVLRAADYARLHMAARPFQLFSIGLLVYGLKFCFAIFDHDGVTFSREGDLRTPNGWKLFVRIVRCLAVTMTDEDMGRDPTAQMLSDDDDDAIPRLREEARSLGLTVPDGLPTFSVSLGDGTGRRWATISIIWSSLSLIGRGTAVWLVQELKDGVPEGTVKVMKTAWRSSRRTSEADIYGSMQNAQEDRGHPCVARLYAGGDVKSRDGREISVSSLRATILQDEAQDDKILHRLLLSPVGRPIWEYESEEMLIRGIKAAIEGHKYLYENGILHRDVSAGNVLLAQHPQPGMEGFITDLDCAWVGETSRLAEQAKMAGKSVPHGGHITGTYQFMSIRVLRLMWLAKIGQNPSEIYNEVRDDLESFVWVFCYALIRHHVSYHPTDAIAEELFHDTYGCLNLSAIHNSRTALTPIFAIRALESSLSAQLHQWFQQQPRGLQRSHAFDLETGFEFTYETLVAWLDAALTAVTEGVEITSL
ncbi:hypothetical protein NM688_g5937 [Phlebia brevispora]|uniref:Uncharacterized protein n=1 Tax=Phlebia brevispora TaxID=194682 RepID=A0ACC1SMH9_9APHY|nr:hypothetical protein NM688_g5937 [Phlebia brevispora]